MSYHELESQQKNNHIIYQDGFAQQKMTRDETFFVHLVIYHGVAIKN